VISVVYNHCDGDVKIFHMMPEVSNVT